MTQHFSNRLLKRAALFYWNFLLSKMLHASYPHNLAQHPFLQFNKEIEMEQDEFVISRSQAFLRGTSETEASRAVIYQRYCLPIVVEVHRVSTKVFTLDRL